MFAELDLVLGHFRTREGWGRGPNLRKAAYRLLRIILETREFESLRELIAFCTDPDNLRPWLPFETDRVVVCTGFRDGFFEIVSGIHARPAAPLTDHPRFSRNTGNIPRYDLSQVSQSGSATACAT